MQNKFEFLLVFGLKKKSFFFQFTLTRVRSEIRRWTRWADPSTVVQRNDAQWIIGVTWAQINVRQCVAPQVLQIFSKKMKKKTKIFIKFFLVGDPCKQPKLSGDGTFTLPRFAYDSLRHDCVPFTYRGLKGNQNNFLTLADCAQICPGFLFVSRF